MLGGTEMLHVLENLFLGIRNGVTHGPFNLTFSFPNCCPSDRPCQCRGMRISALNASPPGQQGERKRSSRAPVPPST